MNYKDKLKSVTTFEQLVDFRDELLIEEGKYSSIGKSDFNLENIRTCQGVNFWLEIVNARIKYLIQEGMSLDGIKIS